MTNGQFDKRLRTHVAYPFVPASSLTPHAFLSFLTRGPHKFTFTEEATGCRNWCKTVMWKMEEEGLGSVGSAETFQGWLEVKSAEVGADRT